MPSLTVCPDVATPEKVTAGVLYASTSDGGPYNQKARNVQGSETWSLRWSTLTETEAQAIMTLVQSVGTHKTFDWTPPESGASAGKYRFLESPRFEARTANDYRVTASVRLARSVF